MSEGAERPHKTGFLWLDLILGAAAIFLSVVSLVVALRADHTQEELLAASVWPYVQLGGSNAGNHAIVQIKNAGVGPARIRWMTVTYRGKALRGLSDLLHACCEDPKTKPLLASGIYSTVSHTVLVTHETVDVIDVGTRPSTMASAVAVSSKFSGMHDACATARC